MAPECKPDALPALADATGSALSELARLFFRFEADVFGEASGQFDKTRRHLL
jgi:hypothetical protein